MFGRGGALQQYDEPVRLLSEPANDFVAGFIGADRGYRGLQFFSTRPGFRCETSAGSGSWELVTNRMVHRSAGATAEPLYDSRSRAGRCCTRRHTAPGAGRGVVVTVGGGVAVDADGKAIGGVRATDVLEALDAQRESLAHAVPVHAPRQRLGVDDRPSAPVDDPGAARAVDRGAARGVRAANHDPAPGHDRDRHIVFTIPSLALFVVLPLIIPTRILDEANVIIALTLYTTALLVRAVPEALDAVPRRSATRPPRSATGRLTRMLKVELPLSIPVLVASLRVIAVTNISMVSVGSVIGIGGLGTWFTEGYQADKSDQIVAGIIAIFVLAVVVDTVIMAGGRLATPWMRVARTAGEGTAATMNFLQQALSYIFTAANWGGSAGLSARTLEHLQYTAVAVAVSA